MDGYLGFGSMDSRGSKTQKRSNPIACASELAQSVSKTRRLHIQAGNDL